MPLCTPIEIPGDALAAFPGSRLRMRPVRRRVLTALMLPLRRVWPGPVFGARVLMARTGCFAGSLPNDLAKGSLVVNE
jgi:hypothetical protein